MSQYSESLQEAGIILDEYNRLIERAGDNVEGHLSWDYLQILRRYHSKHEELQSNIEQILHPGTAPVDEIMHAILDMIHIESNLEGIQSIEDRIRKTFKLQDWKYSSYPERTAHYYFSDAASNCARQLKNYIIALDNPTKELLQQAVKNQTN